MLTLLTTILGPRLSLPILTLPLMAAAAKGHGAAAGGAHEQSFLDYILHSNVINFLLVVAFFYVVIQKTGMVAKIDNSRQSVIRDLESLEKQRANAEEQLKTVQNQVKNLQTEVEDILKTARESAESLSRQIIADAESEAERIVEQSKKRVTQEQRSAVKELQSTLLEESLDDVRQRLMQQTDPQAHRRAIEQFIDALPATVSRP